MRLRASSGRILDLAIRVMALVTVACVSTEGLSSSEPGHGTDGTLPERPTSDRGRSSGTLEPTPTAETPAAKTFCDQAKATFCADFERDLMTGWSSRAGTRGDTQRIDGAFVATTEAVPDGFVPRAYLRKDFVDAEHAGKTEIDYTFGFRIDQLGATAAKGGTLAALVLGTAPLDFELQLNVFADGRSVIAQRGPAVDGGPRPYAEHELPAKLGAGVWRRMRLRLNRASGGSFEVWLDGTSVVSTTQAVAALPDSSVSAFAGVTYADPPAAPWAVRYDDVAVEIR